MRSKRYVLLPKGSSRERNRIPDFRTQEERPVERTQELRGKRTCPVCRGEGEVTYNKPSLSITGKSAYPEALASFLRVSPLAS